MGLIDKIKGMVSIEDPYGEEFEKEDEIKEVEQEETPVAVQENSVVEVKVVRPETFANITEVADYLLERCTIVLNLEATDGEDAKRMLDFLAGVAYSISGQLKCVAHNTYIITPCNVDVADTQTKSTESQQNSTHQTAEFGLTSDTLF